MTGIVGYTRVSTQDRHLGVQTEALRAAGAARIFTDTASGKNAARPGLEACLESLRDGDLLLVYATDRLGRSVTDLVTIVQRLHDQGVQFRSLTEPFDTTAPGGGLFFDLCAAFAQLNGRITTERTRAGLETARARGRIGGRPTVMTPTRIQQAVQMRKEKATWQTIADTLGVGVSSVRRALAGQPTEHEGHVASSAEAAGASANGAEGVNSVRELNPPRADPNSPQVGTGRARQLPAPTGLPLQGEEEWLSALPDRRYTTIPDPS